MSNPRSSRKSNLVRTIRKYFVSAFVVSSFAAYAIHERHNDPNGETVMLPVQTSADSSGNISENVALVPTDALSPLPTLTLVPTQPLPTATTKVVAAVPTATFVPTLVPVEPAISIAASVPTVQPTVQPSATPRPATVAPTPTTAAAKGSYKDGQYTGSVANAFFGPLQVKAVVQNGKLVDVQFLSYPSDRRTSQRINQSAMPRLRSEAIQNQSAQVNIISGATLTSQAFRQSLQSALTSAKA